MFVLIISVIAAFGFSASARKKGYRSPQFWIYPLVVGVVTSLAGLALRWLVPLVLRKEDAFLLRIHPFMIGLFSVLLVLTLIAKTWRQIQALPDRGRQRDATGQDSAGL